MENKEYCSIREIATRLKCGNETIKKLVEREENPLPVTYIGRAMWITEYAIQEWLNKAVK